MSNSLRIDSHQHFWQLSRGDYHWLTTEPDTINRDFLPEDLQPLLASADVDYSIIVQAAETVAETDFILGLADQHNFIAGVVGWVDMNSRDSLMILERLKQHPKFLGIRPIIQGIADPEWMLKPELDFIFRWLIDNDCSFDALVKPIHLNALNILLKRYPELRVVIDHGAKPNIAAAEISKWSEKMLRIAEDSNAYCKLSGLATEAGEDFSYENIRPYMQFLSKSFGAHRLMWGSDWPVCNLALSYRTWVSYLEHFINEFPAEEQQLIWGENAKKFYKLKLV